MTFYLSDLVGKHYVIAPRAGFDRRAEMEFLATTEQLARGSTPLGGLQGLLEASGNAFGAGRAFAPVGVDSVSFLFGPVALQGSPYDDFWRNLANGDENWQTFVING